MQCSNCGSHYRMRDLACPYCGTENALGRLWQKQRTQAEKEYENARIAAGRKWSPFIYDRVVSRIMIIETILLVLSILIAFVFYAFYGSSRLFKHRKDRSEVISALEGFLDSGEYGRFEAYFREYEDRLGDSDLRDEYAQLESIVHYYDQYRIYKWRFLELSEAEKKEDDFVLNATMRNAWLVCTYSVYGKDLYPRTQQFKDSVSPQIISFYLGYLELTQEELDELLALDYYWYSDDEWEQKVRERHGW